MKILRVLSLDGGGMRGLYTATYLDCLGSAFAKRRNVPALDIGKGFNLIVGTSTGAIVAAALAAGVPLSRVSRLYKESGKDIFPLRLPSDNNRLLALQVWNDLNNRPKALKDGEAVLRAALESCLGSVTFGQVFKNRGIALAIPAVDVEQHHSFVFKTPHLPGSMRRDDEYSLVSACLASTAAPLYRSLAALDTPGKDSFRVFVDGGLWANNPVLVALLDALNMTDPGDRIEIFCMGTCPRPAGDFLSKEQVYRGLREWKFGGDVAGMAIDAQEFAYDHMARMLKPHLNRDCQIMRFPTGHVPAELLQYLDLDDTRNDAYRALSAQATKDAEMTNSRSNDPKDPDGTLVKNLFLEMPLA